MRYETKVQKVAGSLTTTIPSTARDFFNLKKGDTLIWEIDFKNDTMTVCKKE